jgi:hypothetical protein
MDQAAEGLAELAQQGFADVPADDLWMITMALLVESAVLLRDARQATSLSELLRPHQGRHVVVSVGVLYYGAVDRLLGLCHVAAGRWSEAKGHLEAAMEAHEAVGAHAWALRSRAELADALLRGGEPDDVRRAAELVEISLPPTRALGMTKVANALTALRREAMTKASASDHTS